MVEVPAAQAISTGTNAGVVTADVKMSEIPEVELTHPRIVASFADTVRRCFGKIAEWWEK